MEQPGPSKQYVAVGHVRKSLRQETGIPVDQLTELARIAAMDGKDRWRDIWRHVGAVFEQQDVRFGNTQILVMLVWAWRHLAAD